MSDPVDINQASWSWWSVIPDTTKSVTDAISQKTREAVAGVKSWWYGDDEKEEREPLKAREWVTRETVLKADRVMRAASNVSRASRRILGAVEEDGMRGPVAGIVGGASAVASLASLREGIDRLKTFQDMREATDATISVCLDVSRILAGVASAACVADEVVEALPLAEVGEPLFMVSGLLTFLSPVRLALRWRDSARWDRTLERRLNEMEALARGPNPLWAETEIRCLLLVLFYELLKEDAFYLRRQFDFKEEDRTRITKVAEAVLADEREAMVLGAEVVRELKDRVGKRLSGHKMELAGTTASLAGFSLFLLIPASLAAQALMGLGSAVALGKMAFEHSRLGKVEVKEQPGAKVSV